MDSVIWSLLKIILKKELQHFAMYNVDFFAQSFEGKIRMHIICGYNDYTPWV